MAEDVLATIRAFVAGELGPPQFRDRLYADEGFETFLSNDPHLRPGNYVGRSVYYFLLEQDYDDPGGVLNAQGALVDFLERNGISYTKTTQYEDFYNLVLEAQPHWLAVEPRWVRDHMLPAAEGRTGAELRDWLREEFLRLFRYVAEPPPWIQSPAWPINENGPLVYLGHLDVNNYFHDAATVYVFHDPVSGTCESIVQVF
jgi:hypothetical protein